MDNNTEEISTTAFQKYAISKPETWNAIIGTNVVHTVWGNCSVERIDLKKSIIYVSNRKVALSFFRDEFFTELKIPSELAVIIQAFAKEQEECDRIKREEDERRKQQEFEEEEKLRKAQIEAQRIERERIYKEVILQEQIKAEAEKRRLELQRQIKEQEAIRLEKIREEMERTWRLELQRQAELQAARELEQAKERQKRAVAIQEFCQKRGIHWLFHFTRLENLHSILMHGLVGRLDLQNLKLATVPLVNDDRRLDHLPNAVCVSISYPNYMLFHKFSKTQKKNWVILVLEPYILWEFDCAFFEKNAASSAVRNMTLEQRKEYSSLVRMFDDQPSVKRSKLGIPDYYPTDPQAEVLALEAIPSQYITSVHFYDVAVMQNWLQEHPTKYSQTFLPKREYFNARMDYSLWQHHNEKSPLDLHKDVFEF